MAQVSAEPDGPGGATARRSVDGRLSGAQAELVQQEENSRRAEREHRVVLDRVAALERSLQATESELQASQVGRGARGAWVCLRALPCMDVCERSHAWVSGCSRAWV